MKEVKVERTCPVCKVTYLADPGRLKHGRQTTCSRKCSYEFRAQELTTSTTELCAACGVQVVRPPSHVKAKTGRVFCSPRCHYDGRSTGLVGRDVTTPYNIPQSTRDAAADAMRDHNAKRKAEDRYAMSDETKQKLSASMSKAIAEGRFSRVSKLEKSVGAVMADLGIQTKPQHGFRLPNGTYGACVDFYIPDQNVALEVNGTFWHCDPRSYPNGPAHASQRHNLVKYAKKMEILVRLGVRVVEVWEADFQLDPVGAVKAALGL